MEAALKSWRMRVHNKHVLMCVGPRCNADHKAEELFLALGRKIDAHGGLRVKRTRANCFAVCRNGPILVVYPDGVWYRQLDEQTLDRILKEHIEEGCPVESHVFHRLGLGDTAPQGDA
jgi:(2Fe-2S) ferredoxin